MDKWVIRTPRAAPTADKDGAKNAIQKTSDSKAQVATVAQKKPSLFLPLYQHTAAGHQVATGTASWSSADYWSQRHAKLATQAKNRIALKSTIFKQVVAYVDGYTGPNVTSRALIELIQAHGGSVLYQCRKKQITHFIATELSAAKRQDLINKDKPVNAFHLVHPDWVTASIDAEKRLKEHLFPLGVPK